MSDKALIEKLGPTAYSIRFQSKVYSTVAVKKAAYKFAQFFSVLIQENDAEIEAQIQFSEDAGNPDELMRAFLSEVLDQDLRERIKAETEATRNLILAHAFSKTSLFQENDS